MTFLPVRNFQENLAFLPVPYADGVIPTSLVCCACDVKNRNLARELAQLLLPLMQPEAYPCSIKKSKEN